MAIRRKAATRPAINHGALRARWFRTAKQSPGLLASSCSQMTSGLVLNSRTRWQMSHSGIREASHCALKFSQASSSGIKSPGAHPLAPGAPFSGISGLPYFEDFFFRFKPAILIALTLFMMRRSVALSLFESCIKSKVAETQLNVNSILIVCH